MGDFFSWGIFVVAGGSALIGGGRKLLARRRVRQELKARPVLDPSTADGSVVRVTGIVKMLEPLTAPLSGKPCVVYVSRVDPTNWVVRGAARRGLRETTVVSPFLVDRGPEGMVLVEGSHAILDWPPQKLKPRDRIREEQFMLASGVPLKERARARFEETIIEEGARVSVAGLIMLDPAEAPTPEERSFRDAPAASLRLTGNVDHPLAIGAC